MRPGITTDDELAHLFREVVLVLGGAFAMRGTDDETIEQVARGLEHAYVRARRRRRPRARPRTPAAPHPALVALLRLAEADAVER